MPDSSIPNILGQIYPPPLLCTCPTMSTLPLQLYVSKTEAELLLFYYISNPVLQHPTSNENLIETSSLQAPPPDPYSHYRSQLGFKYHCLCRPCLTFTTSTFIIANNRLRADPWCNLTPPVSYCHSFPAPLSHTPMPLLSSSQRTTVPPFAPDHMLFPDLSRSKTCSCSINVLSYPSQKKYQCVCCCCSFLWRPPVLQSTSGHSEVSQRRRCH